MMDSDDFVLVEREIDSDQERVDKNKNKNEVLILDNENVQKIRTWLSPTNYDSEVGEYRKHLRAHVPGTGDWLFQTDEFKNWHDSDTSSLLIQGPSGSGKSVLAATLIRRLQQENLPVLFFFSPGLVKEQSYLDLFVRECLSQCMLYSTTLPLQLELLMRRYPTIVKTPFNELWGSLISALTTLPKGYLVFDGLNEVGLEANNFTQRIFELEGMKPNSVKFVKTSRSEVEFHSNPSTTLIELAASIAPQDLQIYINHRLSHQTDRTITTKEQLAIQDTLCRKGNATFLYCRLVLDEMLQQSTPVLPFLQTLPDTLQDLYVYLLHQHSCRSGASLHFQFALLSWITHTSHPLRVIELAGLINSQTNRAGLGDTQDAKHMVRTACGPIVEISEDCTAKLLHSSVTDFLLDGSRNSAEESAESEFWFPACQSALVHRSLAECCINYLVSGCFESWTPGEYFVKSFRSSKENELREKFHFLLYASSRVFYHAELGGLDSNLILLLDDLLLPGSHHFESLKDFCLYPEKSNLPTIRPLHVAAMAGLTSYTKHLLEKGEDPDQVDSDQKTAAILAVRYEGSTETVAVLLEHGASLTKSDSIGWTPLQYAAQNNNFEKLKFLLDSGADPMSPKSPPERITPIFISCQMGHLDLVLELLKQIDSQGKRAIYPHWLGSARQPEILSVLLTHPEILANINEKDALGNTALRSAIFDKDPETVEILLQHGADLPIGAGEANTPLHMWMSTDGPINHTALDFERTGLLLLKAGCDVEAKNARGQSVLMNCISSFYANPHGPGDEEEQLERLVSLLLKYGADACMVDNDGNTILQRYVEKAINLSTKVVKLLTEAGAGINETRNDSQDTPLMTAVKLHRSNINAMIDNGGDPNISDADRNTAMHHVCRDSHMWSAACFRELAESTDVKTKNNKGETCIYALQSTAHYKHISYKEVFDVIPLLVTEGLDLESRDQFGRTALLAMCMEYQQYALIASLIQHGADVKSRDSRNKSCFHMIASSDSTPCHCCGRNPIALYNPLEVMELLVQKGADINGVDFEGNTPFHDAVESGDDFSSIESKLKFIIKCKGSPNLTNYQGQTALHKAAKAGLKTRQYENGEYPHNNSAPVHIDFLLQPHLGIDLNAMDGQGMAAIHYAASISEVITWKFVQAGGDIRMLARGGRTPLHFATEASQSNIVGLLCKVYKENCWTVDQKDEEGRTPLHYAARSGNSESVYYLLQADAEPNVQDNHESTPLHAAAEHHFDENKRKIQHSSSKVTLDLKTIPIGLTGLGPFMEFKDEEGEGPHIYLSPPPKWDPGLSICGEEDACMIQDVVELLLSAGASTTIHDESGRTPYDAAVLQSNEEIAIMLSHHPRDNDITDHLADHWYSTREESAEQTVRDIGSKDKQENGYTLLQTAIYLRSETMFKTLLEAGVDPLNLGPNSLTVAHTIAHFGLLSMMRILSSHVKDLNVFSPPLLHVAATRELSNIQMVDLLIKLGVDVNSRYQERSDCSRSDGPNTPFATPRYPSHVLALQGRWWNISAMDSLFAAGADLDASSTESEPNTILKNVLYGNGDGYQDGYDSSNSHDLAGVHAVRGFWSAENLEVLLKHGADINELSHGMTPLIFALKARLGVKMIRRLLGAGASVALGKEPAIISAVWSGDLEVTRLILDAGAEINTAWDWKDSYSPTTSPVTPLLAALLRNRHVPSDPEDEALITFLLERGANPLMRLKDGTTTVLHEAATYHACLETILKGHLTLDLELEDSQGRTPLLSSCCLVESLEWDYKRVRKDECTARQLILAGANLQATDNNGSTPLHLATLSELVATTTLLLERGADPSIKNHQGVLPLYYALHPPRLHNTTENITLSLTKAFLEAGANPLNIGKNGESALHFLAPWLIKASPWDSDPSKHFHHLGWVPENGDKTAYLEEFRNLYQRFIDKGCDRNSRDKFGNTPLFPYVKEIKHSNGFPVVPPAKEDVQRMFDENDVFAINDDGDTLLHVVAARDELYDFEEGLLHTVWLFKELVARGVDPRKENKMRVTALDVAWFHGNQAILRSFSL